MQFKVPDGYRKIVTLKSSELATYLLAEKESNKRLYCLKSLSLKNLRKFEMDVLEKRLTAISKLSHKGILKLYEFSIDSSKKIVKYSSS